MPCRPANEAEIPTTVTQPSRRACRGRAVWHGASALGRARGKPALADPAGLDGAKIQHAEPPQVDPEGPHPVSRIKYPLQSLIDSTGIKVEGEGARNARRQGGAKRRVWRKVLSGSRSQRWRSGPSRSTAATWAMPPCCQNCSARLPRSAARQHYRLARTPRRRRLKRQARATLRCGCRKPRPGALAILLGRILWMRLPGDG